MSVSLKVTLADENRNFLSLKTRNTINIKIWKIVPLKYSYTGCPKANICVSSGNNRVKKALL